MKIPWGAAVHVGVSVLSKIVATVELVEIVARTIGGMRGKDKQNAVAETVTLLLQAESGRAGARLGDDPTADRIIRQITDLVVELNNHVAQRAGGIL